MKSSKINVTYMVELAVLIAIIIVMAFTPIGYIKTLGLEITLIVVPVCVGAVTLGPVAGLVLGTVFGLSSFIQCFGFSAFGAQLLAINPFLCFIVCVPTRMLMGWLTGVIYKALKKAKPMKSLATPIACLVGPLLNTLFFMSTLCICFYNTEYIQGFVSDLGASNVLLFVLLFVGINGLVEAIACFVVGTAISIPLNKFVVKTKTA
ncbi:MAG: ECF transporter S component [Lachnospiraceae bacterium]|nr:ECF transporter S component [Lachnospiraceae bacterium]